MSLESGEGNGMVMPVAPMYGNNGGFGGWGGDGWWVILFLFALMGNWGGGFGGGMNGGGMMPYFFNNTDNNTQRGFDTAAITSQLSGIQSSISSGFAGAEVAECNRAINQLQTDYQGQINSLERSFNAQTAISSQLDGISAALAKCCCDNQLQTESLRATVLQENCADRYEAQNNARDIIANQTAGFQRILDQMFSDKMDAKNDEIAQLRQEVLYARGQASQIAQNGTIIDGIYNRLNECPVGTVPVYGRQPIFSCNNNGGCGCGNGFNGIY